MEKNREVKRYCLCYKIGTSDLLHFINFSKNEEGKYIIGKEVIAKDDDQLNGPKYTLNEIDDFTNSFNNHVEFFNTVSPYLSYKSLSNDDFFIKYNNKGIKSLRVIFGNKELKEKTEMVSNATIHDPEEVNSIVDLLVNGNNSFVWYLYNQSNERKDYFDINFLKFACEIRRDYKFAKDMNLNTDFIEDKKKVLGSMLSRYKTYRDVFAYKQEFVKSLEKPKTKVKDKPNGGE